MPERAALSRSTVRSGLVVALVGIALMAFMQTIRTVYVRSDDSIKDRIAIKQKQAEVTRLLEEAQRDRAEIRRRLAEIDARLGRR